MLYQIDRKTWLDLPQWKRREEFRQLFLLQRQPHPDPDELERLKAECDRIEQTHIRKSAASRSTATKMWAEPGRDRRCLNLHNEKPVDVFDLDGHYVATFESGRLAADAISPANAKTATHVINKCRNSHFKSAYGYMFRHHVEHPKDIEPYHRKKAVRPAHFSKPHPNPGKSVVVTYPDGRTEHYAKLMFCAEALCVSYGAVWKAMKDNRPLKGGERIEFDN